MNLYNIRIIISGRNEYRGSIIIDENQTLYGVCTERNYDNKEILSGKLTPHKLYLEIQSEYEKVTILASPINCFPMKSIAKSNYFSGNSLCYKNTSILIEITNVKDIEQELVNERNNQMILQRK